MKNITEEQKIYELSTIWKEAAYNFAFWDKVDIDWDEEYKKALPRVLAAKDLYDYYRELMRFVSLLGDGHTGVSFPNEFYQDPECFSMLPVYLWKCGDKIMVLNVSDSVKDSIPLFSTLTRIDGIDAAEYVRENCYPYIWHANEDACAIQAMNELMYGRSGSSAVFTFEKDGRQFDLRLERSDPSKMTWGKVDFSAKSNDPRREIGSSDIHNISITDDGIAVIQIRSFADGSLPDKIFSCLDELKDAKGYILDVRGNGGGNSSYSDAVAGLFIEGEFRSCFAERQVYEPAYKAWSVFREDFKGLSLSEILDRYSSDEESIKTYKMGRNIFYVSEAGDSVSGCVHGKLEGSVAVLMNENTVSAAEDFIDVMKQYTDAVFIGNNTAGTSGQPLFRQLESGGSFRICTCRCIAQNGEDIYNKGFAPDIKVIRTAEDLINGYDRALEKGLEVLRQHQKTGE